MKRYLPFIIIAAVATLTVGAGVMLYRVKQRAVPTASTTSKPVDKTSSETADTFEGKAAHVRGAPDAPVTLEVFGDFQCPSCATVSGLIGKLEQEYGPRLRVVFRHFPLAMHAHAMDAALAAEAAGLQGRFWEMHDLLFANQTALGTKDLNKYAEQLSLDTHRFHDELKHRTYEDRVREDFRRGVANGVYGTPGLFINGVRHDGALDLNSLNSFLLQFKETS